MDRLGKGRTFPGDRIKVPSKTGAVTLVGKVRPMLTVVSDAVDCDGSAAGAASGSSLIDELVREGARRMLAEALRAEVDAYCARFADECDENGRRPSWWKTVNPMVLASRFLPRHGLPRAQAR